VRLESSDSRSSTLAGTRVLVNTHGVFLRLFNASCIWKIVMTIALVTSFTCKRGLIERVAVIVTRNIMVGLPVKLYNVTIHVGVFNTQRTN